MGASRKLMTRRTADFSAGMECGVVTPRDGERVWSVTQYYRWSGQGRRPGRYKGELRWVEPLIQGSARLAICWNWEGALHSRAPSGASLDRSAGRAMEWSALGGGGLQACALLEMSSNVMARSGPEVSCTGQWPGQIQLLFAAFSMRLVPCSTAHASDQVLVEDSQILLVCSSGN